MSLPLVRGKGLHLYYAERDCCLCLYYRPMCLLALLLGAGTTNQFVGHFQ